MLLAFHVVAGALGLISGYTALIAAKGGRLHRRAGTLFLGVMLAMSLSGIAVALSRDAHPGINVPAGVLTAYLVATGWAALRPLTPAARWLVRAGAVAAISVGVTTLVFGFEALASPDGRRLGMPAFPFLLFGVVGVLAATGDVRLLRADTLRGTARLRRHLWRMCFALFIAALSFFIGQAKVLPAAVRIPALLALPVLVVIAAMIYYSTTIGRRSRPPANR